MHMIQWKKFRTITVEKIQLERKKKINCQSEFTLVSITINAILIEFKSTALLHLQKTKSSYVAFISNKM